MGRVLARYNAIFLLGAVAFAVARKIGFPVWVWDWGTTDACDITAAICVATYFLSRPRPSDSGG